MRPCAQNNNNHSSHLGSPLCLRSSTLLGTGAGLWFAPEASGPQEGLSQEPRAGQGLLAEPSRLSFLSSGAGRDLGQEIKGACDKGIDKINSAAT